MTDLRFVEPPAGSCGPGGQKILAAVCFRTIPPVDIKCPRGRRPVQQMRK